jgi:hypothetical protein
MLLAAIALPTLSILTQSGVFGTPDVGESADRYPTLISAAGYAFSIWGVIFALALAAGVWQLLPANRTHPVLRVVRIPASIGWLLCAAWMPIFTLGHYHLAALMLVVAAMLLVYCLIRAEPARHGSVADQILIWIQSSIFAAWVTLASALNLAQLREATGFMASAPQLAFSLSLLVAAGLVVLLVNHRQRGNIAWVATAVWALVAVFVKQYEVGSRDAVTAAYTALTLAVVLIIQLVWLRYRHARGAARNSIHLTAR